MDMSTRQGPKSSEQREYHKSRYSQGSSNCVEVAEGATTCVRDTQHRGHGHLEFGASEWDALLKAAS